MGSVNHWLPDLLPHSDCEVIDVEWTQFNDFVVDLVVAVSWYFDLHGKVLYLDSFNAAWNQPQRGCFAFCGSVNINTANRKHECVSSVFEWEVFDSKAVDTVGVDRVDFNVVNFEEAFLLVVDFEGFILEDFICSERSGQLQNIV